MMVYLDYMKPWRNNCEIMLSHKKNMVFLCNLPLMIYDFREATLPSQEEHAEMKILKSNHYWIQEKKLFLHLPVTMHKDFSMFPHFSNRLTVIYCHLKALMNTHSLNYNLWITNCLHLLFPQVTHSRVFPPQLLIPSRMFLMQMASP